MDRLQGHVLLDCPDLERWLREDRSRLKEDRIGRVTEIIQVDRPSSFRPARPEGNRVLILFRPEQVRPLERL